MKVAVRLRILRVRCERTLAELGIGMRSALRWLGGCRAPSLRVHGVDPETGTPVVRPVNVELGVVGPSVTGDGFQIANLEPFTLELIGVTRRLQIFGTMNGQCVVTMPEGNLLLWCGRLNPRDTIDIARGWFRVDTHP